MSPLHFTEKVLSMPAMFAPIHQVARYIHIINAYCREAELIHDPLRIALWNVLDELIEVHTNIAPKCLFAGRSFEFFSGLCVCIYILKKYYK